MKTLEKIKNHFAVEEYYEDCDGHWANLKDDYTYNGCTFIHELTLTRLLSSLRELKKL